jgi:RHS repeat-associated protein
LLNSEPLPLGSSAERTLTRDVAGGMADNGRFLLRYDERNRLDRVIVGGLTTSYGVNGLGERTTKDGRPAFGVFEHVYDLSGPLFGLYESGALDEEIVWLGALPVGTIQGGAAYSIAPDHLGAPYKIVNAANAQVWVWDHDPFGNGAPTAAAGFWRRLRFPGQVYDSESKLHSNGHRDYDPRLGRYLESDPIGLDGGINTYAYAGNDPVNAIDPLGLYRTSGDGDPAALPEIDIEAQRSPAQQSTPAALPPIDIAAQQYAQLATPLIEPFVTLGGRLPAFPRQLTPLENLPKGTANGPKSGKDFPRNLGKPRAGEDHPPCTYCGQPTGPGKFHRDHIIPRSRGGDGSQENLAPSCPSCNLEKGPSPSYS